MDSESYVLACYRYIELNPVWARMTDDPAAYRWSGCTAKLGHRPRSGLSPHPAWRALGTTDAERIAAYGRSLDEALPEDLLGDIRLYLQQQRVCGCDDFRAVVEARTHRFAGVRPAHRPRKPASPDK